MNQITFNGKQFTDGIKLLSFVTKQKGEEFAKQYYETTIYRSEICPKCDVTGHKLTYHTYRTYGRRAGSLVCVLMRKHKDLKVVLKILNKTSFYIEELNGYFREWKTASSSCQALRVSKKEIYNKYYFNKSKCRLSSCDNKVPFERSKEGSCCVLHGNRHYSLRKGKYTTDDLMLTCAFDGEKFSTYNRLSNHIITKGWKLEDYYKKYIDPKATGKCKWCDQEVPFYTLKKGYRNFCYNSSCNVLWHNKHKNRHNNGEKISNSLRTGQNLKNQIGYWLKKGYTNEEAKIKVRERQSTNSLAAIQKRLKCSKEGAIAVRQEITRKWSDSFKNLNYSQVSQQLFWDLYEKLKETYSDIYFATLDHKNQRRDNSGKNHEYRIKTKVTHRKPDFFIPSINKIIEFDGVYWHGEVGRGNKTKDAERDKEIKEAINCEILHITETEYSKNKNEVLNKCLSFLTN